jgi:hypothetical protein
MGSTERGHKSRNVSEQLNTKMEGLELHMLNGPLRNVTKNY